MNPPNARTPGQKRDISYGSAPLADGGTVTLTFSSTEPLRAIVCAFYGYSTADVGERMPHGIFVSVFDEAWLQP